MTRLRGLLVVLLCGVLGAVLGVSAPATANTLDGGPVPTAGPGPEPAPTPDPARATPALTVLTLDGVTVRLPAGSSQVVTVNHTAGTRARVTLWAHDGARWQALASTTAGRIGYGGLVPARLRKQATGTTPLGTFGLLSAFGTHAVAPGWHLPYRTIAAGDYWVQDNRSVYYNRYRNRSEGGFRWWLPSSAENSSERLEDFPTQYEYSIVTGFNYEAQVRHRGAGIFLHVNGRGATAGCVSAPRWFLRRAMAALDPRLGPVIAIGR